jgi:hypothetical protein
LTGQSTFTSIPPLDAERTLRGSPAPGQTRLLHRGRPLKRWRYVAVFDEELYACAALVQIGIARQSFWALYERPAGRLRERTRMLPRRRELQLLPGRPEGPPGVLRLRDRGVQLELALEEQPGIEALCAHGAGAVWTRKQAGVRAHGTLALDGAPARAVEALAVIDDTAGHHARETEWRWSAGVGEGNHGTALAWNLVSGVNDPPRGSERAVWVGGDAFEPAPVSFAADLGSITGQDGSELRFTAEAERARRENLLVVRSEYRAPFGTFAGTLPGGIELARGLGVMEYHRARW